MFAMNAHLFAAQVKEDDTYVTVENISSSRLERDLYRTFRTSRIYSYLFTQTKSNSVKMHRFFALEFYYILEMMKAHPGLFTPIRKIAETMDQLKQNTWLRTIDTEQKPILDLKHLSAFLFKPLPHQSEFFVNFNRTVPQYNLRGMLLAAEPGTGKTYASLALAKCLQTPRVVVICPLNAIETVWQKSITGKDSLYREPPTLWRLDSGKPYAGEHIMLCHNEGLGKFLHLVKQMRMPKCTVILDESHNFNESVSQRSQYFTELCDTLDCYVVLASGTPIKALATEATPLLRAIDPLFTADVAEQFKKMHRGSVSGITAVLNRRLNVISHRVGASALGLKEPHIEYLKYKTPNSEQFTLVSISNDMLTYAKLRMRELELERPERKAHLEKTLEEIYRSLSADRSMSSRAHADLDRDFRLYRENLAVVSSAHESGSLSQFHEEMKACREFERLYLYPNVTDKQAREYLKDTVVIVKYYRLKVQGECLGRVLGRKRIDAYVELCQHVNYEDIIESTQKKTLIFTSFIEVVEKTEQTLLKQKYKPLKVYGEHIASLAPIVERYRNDKNANPLVATYSSLSTAVPLTMADTMVAINPPYREYIMKQAIARIHRIGATTPTRVFHVSLDTGDEPNISDRMIDIIQWSRDQSQAILNLEDGVTAEDEEVVSTENYTDPVELNFKEPVQHVLNRW